MDSPIIPKLTWQEWKQVLHGFHPGNPTFLEKDYPSLDGKVVIVTGGSTGVGYQVVKSLAGSTNAKIYIFSRNQQKARDAIERMKLEIAEEYSKAVDESIKFVQVDLSDLTTIKPAVSEFLQAEDRLDIIIHNAGIMMPPRGSVTKQGYQMELGTNNIGPQLLQNLLDPIFIKTSSTNKPNESRIVWIASTSHFFSPLHGINWNDPNYRQVTNVPLKQMYSQSKAINIIQAQQWPVYHPEATNAVSISVCPGYLKTELQRNTTWLQQLGYSLLFHNPRYGAYTELFAALSPDITSANNGQHVISFGHFGEIRKDLEEKENSNKVWNFLQDQINQYV
ncbi:short-chain alcohol dehydrogenase [Spathaspora passalidarum NRRL Y-27907]|uniref:Short-chain alcohol dehydrogenase n=1 Tax=Spathaspora passalidarum (strain NRRL Y-27907 / 11-Y1) TaxID=619300 RepID=G3AGN5_SPAPN|nr:short-chain alcohol dehydrogenase [Spathaspora passalidarum NRRL Y-27907]EGW35374.1 short-chain alcohol dehydrogenase [Spathaspora passalidarum NRRL Y-27907]